MYKKGKMSKYSMEMRGDLFYLVGEGLFSCEDARSFIYDFKTFVKKNRTNDKVLLIDNRNLKTSCQEVKPFIEEMSLLYRDTPFKKKFIMMPKSLIASMQLKRDDETGIFDQFEYIDC